MCGWFYVKGTSRKTGDFHLAQNKAPTPTIKGYLPNSFQGSLFLENLRKPRENGSGFWKALELGVSLLQNPFQNQPQHFKPHGLASQEGRAQGAAAVNAAEAADRLRAAKTASGASGALKTPFAERVAGAQKAVGRSENSGGKGTRSGGKGFDPRTVRQFQQGI